MGSIFEKVVGGEGMNFAVSVTKIKTDTAWNRFWLAVFCWVFLKIPGAIPINVVLLTVNLPQSHQKRILYTILHYCKSQTFEKCYFWKQ